MLDRGTGDVVTPALMCHSSPIHGRHAKQGRHGAVSGVRFITVGKKKKEENNYFTLSQHLALKKAQL